MKVLESKVCFHNSGSFDSGPEHVLLGGDIGPVGYPLEVIQVASGGEGLSVQTDACTLSDARTNSNSLSCRVVELVLPGAAEASLDSSVVPEPLDDPGQFPRHEALFCRSGQHEQLPRVVLQGSNKSKPV